MVGLCWWLGVASAAPNWSELGPTVASGDAAAMVVRVLNADSSQAPMVHMKIDGVMHEMACADDGSFPDATPDDGVFHCARKISMGLVESKAWTGIFSVRDGNGEDQVLGTLEYPKGGGYRFAVLTMGETGAAAATEFDLPSTDPREPGTPPAEATGSEATPGGNSSGEPEPPPEPSPPPSPPAAEVDAVAPPSTDFTWLWVIGSCAVGWFAGRRFGSGSSAPTESARVLPLGPIDGSGPVPGAAVTVAATDAEAAVRAVWSGVTGVRRLVLVGELPKSLPPSAHDALVCTDPDPSAVHSVLNGMRKDGGVPPVVLVMGSNQLLDTGGTSGEPNVDLLDAVAAHTWVLFFVRSDESAIPGTEAWSHDPQAGWSQA